MTEHFSPWQLLVQPLSAAQAAFLGEIDQLWWETTGTVLAERGFQHATPGVSHSLGSPSLGIQGLSWGIAAALGKLSRGGEGICATPVGIQRGLSIFYNLRSLQVFHGLFVIFFLPVPHCWEGSQKMTEPFQELVQRCKVIKINTQIFPQKHFKEFNANSTKNSTYL